MANELFDDVQALSKTADVIKAPVAASVPKVAGRVYSQYQTAFFGECATGRGHVVVEAVAGSGKTTSLEEGIRHMAANKSVVVIAFNKSTAAEFKSRIENARAKGDTRGPARVDVMTAHGLGFRAVGYAWRNQVGRVGVNDKREWELCERITTVIDEVTGVVVSRWQKQDIAAVCKLVAFAKAWVALETKNLEKLAIEYDVRPVGVSVAEMIDRAHEVLQLSLQPSAEISFDDMVFLPVALGLRPLQYDVVIVDETQDLNRAQVELALMACRRGGRIIAVGDSRQAIYGFRGADSRSMPNLIKRLSAKTMPLSVCYRCPRSVIEHVKPIVPRIEAAPGAAEGEVVDGVDAFDMMASWRKGDFVISRINAPLVKLCLLALRDGIPAFVMGRDLGANVRSLIERYRGGQSVIGMIEFVRGWFDEESARLTAAKKEDKIESVRDLVDTVIALTEGCGSVSDVLRRTDTLFADSQDTNKLVFSSTHRIKGREAHRVWLLAGTFRAGTDDEESNLYYVACTRAQEQLNLVSWDPKNPPL